ncbi:MAG: hypothetical protein AAB221_13460 [Bacteroidota bacterium]
MKKTVKALVLITIAAFFLNNAAAQLKLPVINGVTNDLKKVIEDYPNHFASLIGEMITQNTQSTDYQCTFNANGAEQTTVTRYSAKKEMYSWQALMLTTESFEKARQKFRSLFSQLNNLSVRIGHQASKLNGDYETPDEKKKFTTVLFSFDPPNEVLGKLKVEVTMEVQEPLQWAVKIIVYDREKEDNEKGKTEEEESR